MAEIHQELIPALNECAGFVLVTFEKKGKELLSKQVFASGVKTGTISHLLQDVSKSILEPSNATNNS